MNLKQQFYRNYYDDFDYRIVARDDPRGQMKSHNEDKLKAASANLYRFQPGRSIQDFTFSEAHFPSSEGFRRLTLQTTYPGLISGTGYQHETKTIGEIKIGFHFDHVTGLPVLPGSGVKGMLRSVFPRRKQQGTTEPKQVKDAKARLILQLLIRYGVAVAEDDFSFVDQLEAHVFGSGHDDGSRGGTDRFFDAVISRANPEGYIVGPDVLTPHGDNPLKEPTPLPFLKVLPAVAFTFTYQLHPCRVGEVEVTINHKERLFRAILLLFGIGAKTNVGYGQLEDTEGEANEFDWLAPDEDPSTTTNTDDNGFGDADDENDTSPDSEDEDIPSLEVFKATIDKWFKAGSLNPKRPPKVNAKVLRKIGDNAVEVQILVHGLSDPAPVKCPLKVFGKSLPKPGHWVEVQLKSFSGKKASASNFLLKDNYYKLIGKSE